MISCSINSHRNNNDNNDVNSNAINTYIYLVAE